MLYWAYWKDSDQNINASYPLGTDLQDVANDLAHPKYPDIILRLETRGSITTKRLGVDYFESKRTINSIQFRHKFEKFRSHTRRGHTDIALMDEFIKFAERVLPVIKEQ